MKTLDEVIAEMEYEKVYNSGESRSFDDDALHYLKEYRDLRKSLIDKRISYCGKKPVVEVDGYYFMLRYFHKPHNAWRCDRVEESTITHDWTIADDDTYVIDNNGKILFREVGWDMRREEYEKGKVSK